MSIPDRPRLSGASGSIAAPLVVLLLFVLVWHLFVVMTGIPPVNLPGPLAVADAAVRLRQELLLAVFRTAVAALTGLLISTLAGVITACLFSASGLVRRALYPYAVLLQTIPVIAVAPIIIVTTGRGFWSICLVSAIISLFPIITNTTTGLLQIDEDLLDLFRLHRATWLQTLLRLRLPSAMPYVIAGLRIASGSAIVGAIVGEFFVGTGAPGLGTLIQRKAAALNLSELFAVVIASSTLGTVAFAAISIAGEIFLSRRFGTSLSGLRTR